jgi:hypothetical protein
MAMVGYHASHEQFAPSELLKYTQMAEKAGFEVAMCSDHFHPWGNQQGHSGFAWSWLGGSTASNFSFLWYGLRPWSALSPRRYRSGRRYPGGDVPRSFLDRAGERREHQRTHHWGALAYQS